MRYGDSSLACSRRSDRGVWREVTDFPVHACLHHPHNPKAWNRRFPAGYIWTRLGGGGGSLEYQQNHWQVSYQLDFLCRFAAFKMKINVYVVVQFYPYMIIV